MKEDTLQTVLIVDDMFINIEILAETLKYDYEIMVATNGFDAIEIALSEYPPDLILLDIMMPDMDGYEVCSKLKSNEKTKQIPIIFITAKSEEDEETKGFELGAVDYITKPFSPAIVKARVSTHMQLKRYRDSLQRSEEYLRTIMNTIQTGVVVIDLESQAISDANPYVAKMLNSELKDLIGQECSSQDYQDIFDKDNKDYKDNKEKLDKPKEDLILPKYFENLKDGDCVLKMPNKDLVYVRKSFAKAVIKDKNYLVQSFLDITDIKNLLKKQEISIELAKNILNLINKDVSDYNYFEINQDLNLFANKISLPCNAEGGDHFFVKRLSNNNLNNKIFLSLKDQSGHEVGCILRSIITDFIHNNILDKKKQNIQEIQDIQDVITELNNKICDLKLFNSDDFFTAICAELDTQSLNLSYISAGHPPFILIRKNLIVKCIPDIDSLGNNMPIALLNNINYTSGNILLEDGDKLIFYTDGLTEMPIKNTNKLISSDELEQIVINILNDFAKNLYTPSVCDIAEVLISKIANISSETVIPKENINTSSDDVTLVCLEIENKSNYSEVIFKPKNHEDVLNFINNLYEEIKKEWEFKSFENPEARLYIILEEAILNAWNHGNKRDINKAIIIRKRYGNDFHLEVIDQGQGFNYECIPDPTLKQNLTKPCGRGIYIINNLADKAEWQENGKHLVMLFKKYHNLNLKKQKETTNFIKIWED